MPRIELNDTEPRLNVTRYEDDGAGDVVLRLNVGGDTIAVNVGNAYDDAEALAAQLESALRDLRGGILDGWEDDPRDDDGWITLDRGGYSVSLGGRWQGGGRPTFYPRAAIAIYELARMMADAGEFANAWAGGEHGPSVRSINAEVRAFHDAGGDKLAPLPGVRFAAGDPVTVTGEDWSSWIVAGDWGDLGIMLHTEGDPSVTMFLESESDRARVQPWPEGDRD